eukprot:gnl/Ergobibamus_cyprinoides/4297.p3 GENE.gnl/Ergobibamus_cyprinoides/4297~~gnl/Ergobibamus_cyprinoides/4297.p3  ORF type:complete len:175 (+),score=43.37 gnl/Ergobibamus_cyprinoides/4297:349-873(+)
MLAAAAAAAAQHSGCLHLPGVTATAEEREAAFAANKATVNALTALCLNLATFLSPDVLADRGPTGALWSPAEFLAVALVPLAAVASAASIARTKPPLGTETALPALAVTAYKIRDDPVAAPTFGALVASSAVNWHADHPAALPPQEGHAAAGLGLASLRRLSPLWAELAQMCEN